MTVTLGQVGEPSSDDVILQKSIHAGDTLETIATAYALELNRGYTGVWASASANIVTIYARTMGIDGDNYTLTTDPTSGAFIATPSGATFAGGMNGIWRTDLAASPRLNRAVRDWSLSFFTAMQGYGIDVTASFSMELGNGDPSASAGIAQVGPSGIRFCYPRHRSRRTFRPRAWRSGRKYMRRSRGFKRRPGSHLICSSAKCSGGIFRTMVREFALFRACRSTTRGHKPVLQRLRSRDGHDYVK